MNEDNLYQLPSSQLTQNTTSAPNVETNTINAFDGANFGLVLYFTNIFVLVWTVFYSTLLFADFYFYRVKYSEGETDRELKGVTSIRGARRMWITYLVCLGFYTAVYFTNGGVQTVLTVITIIVYILKVAVADIPIIPYFSGVFQAASSWVQSMISAVQSAGSTKK